MASTKTTEIQILQVEHQTIDFAILGSTPIILHRMSQKSAQQLLMPSGKKTAAEKQSTLKTDIYYDFAQAPYTDKSEDGRTLLTHLSSAFKNAIRGAALDMPGTNKSQIGRLTWINGERVPIWGIPELFISIVRNSDVAKTPDMRTRCIVPQWAAEVSVTFVKPNLRENAVVNLLASAGITQGVGDWRPSKGAGTYGQFEIVAKDDPRWQFIVEHGGRAAQIAAMESPESYDTETAELREWYDVEIVRRGFKAVK